MADYCAPLAECTGLDSRLLIADAFAWSRARVRADGHGFADAVTAKSQPIFKANGQAVRSDATVRS